MTVDEIRNRLTPRDKAKFEELVSINLSSQPDGMGCYYGTAETLAFGHRTGNRINVDVAMPHSPLNESSSEFRLILGE